MSKRMQLSAETRNQILSLNQMDYGTRRIARRLGCSRKIVRRVLGEAGLIPHQRQAHSSPRHKSQSKLAPFQTLIEEKVQKGLTTSRILREISQMGYQGGRTILAEQVRHIRMTLGTPPHRCVKRRFETQAGLEMQIDWSPYRIMLGPRTLIVHALGCLLAYSRKLFVYFFSDERQPTLLEGLAMAFEYFKGSTSRLVLDNMSTAVLGRYQADGTVLWNARFLEFARHYGFTPFACKPRDPDRKGKKEKSFRLLWDDFLKASHFASFEDLNTQARLWLDETAQTANLRVHRTTRRVPNEVWMEEERPVLIELPEKRFPVYEQSVRLVDADSTLSVRGTRYTIPSTLANRSVAVRLFAEHFEVLDAHGHLAWSRRYASQDQHGTLIIDPTHYATTARRPSPSTERLDAAFLARYPSLAPLVRGLQLKMKSLAGVHLRALLRLVDRYGTEAFVSAAEHAQCFRRYDARAVERILEERHGPGEDPNLTPLGGLGADLVADVDGGELDAYSHLDAEQQDMTETHPHHHQDDTTANNNTEPNTGSQEN